MGGRGRAAVQELKQREERREEEERFAWLAQEEMSRGDPFAEYADPHIPRRFKQPMASSSKRDVARELESGAVPSIGRMTEEEYAEWIRNGMYRLKHKEEYAQREREKEAKLQKEIEREKAREEAERRERRHERKRREALRLEEAKKEEEAKAQSAHDLQQERERYQARWTSITSTGEVEETQLAFEDIPWPIYKPITLDNLTKDRIRTFLHAQGGDVRKVLRETIRSFHPDRFFGRILPRVRASDADQVKQGVETCSRIINDLLRE
jgi:flagellar biosynthesis GTPase FlhF